ncbi:MAG: flagellar biosynthesis anti-sigma factor FlgM [Limnochordaceae bacterium]|nr:flagellar biosynthesis anti-sigma factor FlgM [Limnochordaceae bacterium]
MEPPKDISPIGRPAPVGPSRPAAARRPQEAPSASDEVALSTAGQEIVAARRRIDEAPDVREGLVARLRKEIEQGQYHPSAAEIARRLARVLRPHAR